MPLMVHWLMNWIEGDLYCLWAYDEVHPTYYRYRQVPTFGRDGIRKFSASSSEMKRMAAHDFEDLLQVSPSLL